MCVLEGEAGKERRPPGRGTMTDVGRGNMKSSLSLSQDRRGGLKAILCRIHGAPATTGQS